MDYSERISHNEQRIAELKGRIYTDKLTIKSLVKENEKLKTRIAEQGKLIDFLTDGNKDLKQLVNENERLNKELRIFEDGLKAEIRETKIAMDDWHECLDDCRKLKKENQSLQFKIIELLDFVKENEPVTRAEIKEWWNTNE